MSTAVKLAGLARAWAAYDRAADYADAEFGMAADALDGTANLTAEDYRDRLRTAAARRDMAETAARKARIGRVAALGLGT